MDIKKAVLSGMILCSIPISSWAIYSDRVSYDIPQYEIANSNEVLQAGTIIPATLVTKLTSDNMASVVIAVVRQSVYDSVTGENVLIPAGSRLIGEPIQMTGSRINSSFHRIIFPNGHSVQIPNYEAIDGIGQAGLKDKYTKHSWVKVRSVLTGAILAGGVSASTKSSSSSNSNNESATDSAMKGAVTEILQGISDIATKDANSVTPTGVIREGFQFNILLHTDIRIKPYGKR